MLYTGISVSEQGWGLGSSDEIRANSESLEWGGLCYVFGTKVFVVSVYFFYFCFWFYFPTAYNKFVIFPLGIGDHPSGRGHEHEDGLNRHSSLHR